LGGRADNLNGSRDHNHAPLEKVCHQWARTSYDQAVTLSNKSEISMLTHYEDIKGDKMQKLDGLGGTDHSRSSATYLCYRVHMTFYSTIIETMHLPYTFFELLSLISQNLKTSRDHDHTQPGDSC